MKPTNILLALSLVLASSLASHAQVGIGTATPAASSILDLTSTTQGLLAPRMTEAQRTAIASPENGLIVYQTDGNVGLWVYNTSTSSWTLSTAANTAATVTNVAAGTIAAVNVQGALDELDLEKAPIASPTFTGTVTAPTFVGDLTGNVTGDLTGNAATATLASTVTNNADLSGAVVSTGNTTSLGTFTSTELSTALFDKTGTGVAVFAESPTLVTPDLGTPSFLEGTNITGTAAGLTAGTVTTNADLTGAVVSWSSNYTSLGTFTSTELSTALFDKTGTGVAVFAESPTLVTPDLGTPSFLEGTNITGTAAGLTAGTVTTNADLTGAVVSTGNTTSLGAFSSADLEGALSDETGTGVAVFATSPTLVTPIIGTLGTAVTAIIMNSQSAVPNTSIVSGSTTEVTYSVNNVLAGATALVSFDHALYPGIYVAYTRTTVSNVIVGYGNATNTNQILSANATTNIKITVIQ